MTTDQVNASDATEVERLLHSWIDHLTIEQGCTGVTLTLLGEYLCGMAQAAEDVRAMAGEQGEAGKLVTALRPIVRSRGYERQYRFSMKAAGLKAGGA